MKNRILLTVLSIAFLFLVMPFCVVNAGDIPTADVTVTSWSDLQQEINSASGPKVIKLDGNIIDPNPATESTITIPDGKNITIDLNGYIINRGLISGGVATPNSHGSVIEVYGVLTIVDGNPNSVHKGTLSENGYFWTWDGGDDTGDTVINGGIITGGCRSGNYNGGSGVRLFSDSSIFNMKGGTISGNKSLSKAHAGGVYVNYGTFNMIGGQITFNSADLHGGGVFVRYGKFIMSGTAKITKNVVSSNGGGVYLMSNPNSSFTMDGGEISYNRAKDGGGVRVESSMTMNGGVIKNNIATGEGGGVRGSVIMTDGEISGNTASSNGGGIRGVSTISGGLITGNTSNGNGGGCYGNVTMTGGVITGNSSNGNGGGFYVDTSIILGGSAIISGNYKGDTVNNVFLGTDKAITISSDKLPTSDMNIGVTTATVPVAGTPVAITSNGSEDDVNFFFSDNPNYLVRFNTNHIELHVHEFIGDYIEYDTVNHKWAKKCSCGAFDTENSLIGVDIPTAKTNLIYNGKEQIGVESATGYIIINNKATNASDSYKATATLEEGYIWSDGTLTPKEIDWSIAKLDEITNPQTGDTSNINLWITIFAFSSLGFCTCFVIGKRNFWKIDI